MPVEADRVSDSARHDFHARAIRVVAGDDRRETLDRCIRASDAHDTLDHVGEPCQRAFVRTQMVAQDVAGRVRRETYSLLDLSLVAGFDSVDDLVSDFVSVEGLLSLPSLLSLLSLSLFSLSLFFDPLLPLP